MQTRVISFINHKGGVGKTTTTLNLGKALAILGKKTLIIDIDPQSNLSQSVGIEEPEYSIYDVLCDDIKMPIRQIGDNFYIVPAELGLSVAETKLQAEHITGYFKLHASVDEILGKFDFILIDCPPSLGVLTINALLASTEIVIIVEPQYLPIKGLNTIWELYLSLKKRNLNKNLKILGLLFTQFNRTIVSKSIIEQVLNKYKDLPFNTIIRQSVKISEASAKRQDIFEYDGGSAGAYDYLDFAQEIIDRTEPFPIEVIKEQEEAEKKMDGKTETESKFKIKKKQDKKS